MLLNDKKGFVGKFLTQVEHMKKMSKRVHLFTNIYIKNFGDKLDEDGLKAMFEKYDIVKNMTMMKDRGKLPLFWLCGIGKI